MKAKLLKKIRKEFAINYYPHKVVKYEITFPFSQYSIALVVMTQFRYKGEGFTNEYNTANSLEEAKYKLMYVVRFVYSEHSRLHKLRQIKEKVWYK